MLCLAALLPLLAAGCATKYATLRPKPTNPLSAQLNLMGRSGPEIGDRTRTLLRHYALEEEYKKEPAACLHSLQSLSFAEKGADKIYATAELAYIQGVRAERSGDEAATLDLMSVAVSNAYIYLFCPELDNSRNPYDPQFRGACDVYNGALEATLRIVNRQGKLRPGQSYAIGQGTPGGVSVESVGGWHEGDFDRLEFCSDYEVAGLDTSNVSYGIGVPMIAVRKKHEHSEPAEDYYPEGLAFAVTALLRVKTPSLQSRPSAEHRYECVLELHDPLAGGDITLANRRVPLQTDLSTPLAYFLDNPQFQEKTDSTLGLINPAKTAENRGIYMLEPFDPQRIPVLMVHGLWSSPLTWMPMFNDLRSFPELRRHYQFWFYQYPTGQPFWISAAQLREDLYGLRRKVDPQNREAALDRMVLVGHSMGGLVSLMQTIESGDDFWEAIGNKPFGEIRGSREEVERLAAVLFFHPNRSIRRVITIGTPHRGSDFANDTTSWLSRKFIKLPSSVTNLGNSLVRQNPELFHDTELLTVNTSIDSLSPSSPIFPAMLRAQRASWVRYHNIIGSVPNEGIINRFSQGSDGIVSVESAQLPEAQEIEVASGHSDVHRHPRSILEVRRILVEHLEDAERPYQIARGGLAPLLSRGEARQLRDAPVAPQPIAGFGQSPAYRPLPEVIPAAAAMPAELPYAAALAE